MTARRREFSPKVREEIVERSKNERGQICCEGCSLVLGSKPYHLDHTIPEALFLDKSRPLTAADGKLLGWACCHKPKTAIDQGDIAKVKRVGAKHDGYARRSSRPMDGSRRSPWKKPLNGPAERRY